MTNASLNVDAFLHRPVDEVLGLLPGTTAATLTLADLAGVGVDTTSIRILYGAEGARILDRTGQEHGLGTRIVRFLQNLGYDQSILAAYDQALRQGEALIHVPCRFAERRQVGDVLMGRGGHGVIYFGNGSVETLTGP